MKLLENTGINKYATELANCKQLPYGLVYILSLVKLEILKTYIQIYLKTRFIRLSKSPANTLILFNKKLDGSFYLCVNYQGLNNLTINNQYPLLLISETLDCLGWAK